VLGIAEVVVVVWAKELVVAALVGVTWDVVVEVSSAHPAPTAGTTTSNASARKVNTRKTALEVAVVPVVRMLSTWSPDMFADSSVREVVPLRREK